MWSASSRGYFSPRKRVSGTLWIGGWTSLTINVDASQERNLLPLSGKRPLAVPP
jgi:hypothetical protein